MNVVREIERINERELELNVPDKASWHAQYRHSAYVFIAGLDSQLTEGDVICCFSQFGEVVDCNLVRDKDSGKSRGFAFLAYEDQRSTVLAIDNLNGAKLLNRTLRVDHADKYRRPKETAPAPGQDAEFLQFEGEQSPEYDRRRRAIWDYEAYAPPAQAAAVAEARAKVREAGAASAPTSYSVDVKALKAGNSSEDRNAERILRLWEERQERRRQAEAEEKRREAEKQRGRGRDGRRRFGDQPLQPPPVKEAKEERPEERKDSSDAAVKREGEGREKDNREGGGDSRERGRGRSGRQEEEEGDSRRRRRDDSRDRSPRRSPHREDSRHRHRRRDRDRERDRERDLSLDRHSRHR